MQTINHLTQRYCIEYGAVPPIDYSESIGHKCIMNSGFLFGERVYWADCPNDTEPFPQPPPQPPPPPLQPPPPVVQSDYWSLDDGSRMTLDSGHDKPTRVFKYEIPIQPLIALGVSRDTVLFEGMRKNEHGKPLYSGKAYAFSRGCPPLAYDVIGAVSADPRNITWGDQRQVTLQGRMPVRDAACRITGYRDMTMIFTWHDSLDNWGAN